MHMADGLVTPAVAGVMYAASTAAAIYSIRKIKSEDKKIPLMGIMGAFVFAVQMLNFTIPGTGSSGHLCGGLLLSAILGPYAGFITMISILVIQCLMFADGGLLALGCNIWNMAFYGCFIGYLFIYKPIISKGNGNGRIILASVLASVISLQLGAFSVVIETMLSGVTELPFAVFLSLMQPIHLAIGIGEGLITSAVLIFISQTRPELLDYNTESQNKFSYKKTLAILCIAVAVLAGGVSLFASSNPDGLEWSIERVTGVTDIDRDGKIYKKADDIQSKLAVLPDYALPDNDSAIGTSLSGIVGCTVVMVICIGGALAVRKISKRKA
ncbi:MAG: energy-coupling factor ABC transporter permease [Clostridia bacterium]|nr:energy-coupling factor ABC transporter permease [Clostridia bacterium]